MLSRTLNLLLLIAVLFSAACKNNPGKDLPSPTDGVVRIGTYNVGVFDKSGFDSTEMIAAMMKELGVQVLSMNELDSCNTRHPSYQIKLFSEAMGEWGYNFAPAMPYKGGAYGVGVAYSPKLKLIRESDLSLAKGDGSEPRAVAVCEFKDFVFCSTHLDHRSANAQLAQAQQICDWAAKQYGRSRKPVIMCGDFNALPDSETINLMKKDWTIISPDEFTFSAKNPSKCIDYIMVYKNAAKRVEVLEAKVCKEFETGSVSVASDHLPVYLKIRIR
ncbi:MAG: endonuclease/exonuclease/phosphatase family protein [Bacteroidales bacterium]|nr:endonuclease/exonuclease/phosphatase family protein [Bacteroidales bacterium]